MKLNILSITLSFALIIGLFIIPINSNSDFLYKINHIVNKDYKFISENKDAVTVEDDLLKRKKYDDLSKDESAYLISIGRRAAYTSKYARSDYKMYRLKSEKENINVIKYESKVDTEKLKAMLSEDIQKILRFDMHYFGKKIENEK